MLLWKETKRALRRLLLPMTLGLKNTLATETFWATGLTVLSGALFYWFLKFYWLGQTSALHDLSSTVVDTVTGEVSLSIRASRSRVLVSLSVDDEDELEEYVEQ